MENINNMRAIRIGSFTSQHLKQTDFSEYEYLGIVYEESIIYERIHFYYVLGNNEELMLYEFNNTLKGVIDVNIPIITTDANKKKYNSFEIRDMLFDRKKIFAKIQQKNNFLTIKQSSLKKIFLNEEALNKEFYINSRDIVLEELGLIKLNNETRFYDPLKNDYLENIMNIL